MKATERLRVAAYPRDPNPYQSLLYQAMAHNGVEVTYLGELTPSHSLNQLLLPVEVIARSRGGLDVVHLHWVFGFRLPGRDRFRAVGLLSQAWFHMFLRAVRASGVQLVWTAHNVLPHQPVFWDEVGSRRALVEAADLVIAHTPSTLDSLDVLDMHARATAVVPHGPLATRVDSPRRLDTAASQPLTLLFVGSVAEYKGVEDLVSAFGSLSDKNARLIVAGRCTEPDLARRLRAAAQAQGDRIDLRLERMSDAELDDVLYEADVLVLPYREVTTSGVAVLGLEAGLPLVVPDLPGLDELPPVGVFRYRAHDGLADLLEQVVRTPRHQLRAMGSAGRDAAPAVSWADIAATTTQLFRALVPSAESVR